MTMLVLLKLSLWYDDDHNNDYLVVIIAVDRRPGGEEAMREKGGAQTTKMTMAETIKTDTTMTPRQSQSQ